MSEPSTSAVGTNYAEYLALNELLELQRPLTPEAHDELLFIIIHQAYELWFKLILHELRAAREALDDGSPQAAVGPLRRVVAVERVLQEQLSVLATMGPEGFLEFRERLEPASGFQSVQFREIEQISGLARKSGRFKPVNGDSLYDAFCSCGRAIGLDLPDGDTEAARKARLRALADLYRSHDDDPLWALLHIVAELMVDHDEAFARWRANHMLMAARQIGMRRGTGGSPGVDYLKTTLDKRFFPELWDVRSEL